MKNNLHVIIVIVMGFLVVDAKADFEIALGTTEVIPNPTPEEVPIYPWFPDGHISYIPDTTPGQYQMYWSGSSSYKTTGASLTDMNYVAGSVALPKGNPGEFDNGGAWLMSVYRQSGDNMIGFFHGEDHEFSGVTDPNGIAWKSIAVCNSLDNGDTWVKGGVIINHADPKPATATWGGTGDNCVVWDEANSRWVCYYGTHYLHMAISEDPDAAPGSWRKYYNGAFDEPGLGGQQSPVPGLESRPGANPSVHFNTYLNQWVMIWHSWEKYEDTYLWLSTSTDMVHWRKPIPVKGVTGNQKDWYPTIIGSSDVEAGQVASLCYAHWPDTSNWQRQFIRRDITFTLTENPAAPIGLSALSAGDSIHLDWSDNAETDLSHYTLYRSETSGSGYVVLADNLTTSEYTDDNFNDGTTYYYVVKARDADGDESDYSAEASANNTIYSNIAINGDFSGDLDNWFIWYHEDPNTPQVDSYAEFNVVDGELVVSAINGNGRYDWISILNDAVSLVQGKTYVISFEARSAAERWISVGPRQGSGTYSAYSMREFQLTTTMERHSFTYSHLAADDPAAQLIFFFSSFDDTVIIDNLTIGEKVPIPSSGPDLKILPIGDSITHGNLHGSGTYRKPLYYALVDAGYTVDFVGNRNTLSNTGAMDGAPDSDLTWDQNHEAYWGYTTGDLEGILTDNADDYAFDAALIHLGTNDVTRPMGIANGVQNLKDIIGVLRSENENVVIFLAQLIPSGNGSNANIETFNREIPGIVDAMNTAQSPVILVNQNQAITAGTRDYADPLHPSRFGAVKMANVWLNAINNYYQTVTTYQLTYTAGTGGTISGQSSQAVVENANGLTVTAVPNAGYEFDIWSDGVMTATRTDTNITEDLSVTATFQLSETPLAPSGLSADTGSGSIALDWNENTEPDLSFYTVYRSETSGSGYSVIANNVSSSAYTDNPPQDGKVYYYVVTATDTDANESDYSSQVSAYTGSLPNLLTNGDFSSGLTNWFTWFYPGNNRNGDFNVFDGELVVENIRADGQFDWISVLYDFIELTNGKTYTISFDARSTAPRSITVGPRIRGEPYSLYGSEEFNIGTTMQTYSFDYRHRVATDLQAQLIFLLGATNDSVYLDNVSVVETDTPPPPPGPSLKILPIGDSITQGNAAAGYYRKPLYYQLTDAGYTIDFVGSVDTLQSGVDLDTDWDHDHEAHWGRTTGYLENRLTNQTNNYDFDAALIHLGTNDAINGVAGGIQNLKDIIGILRSDNPEVVIFLAQLIPGVLSGHNSAINNFNAQIPAVASEMNTEQSPVILVNQNTTLVPGTSDYVDNLHPSHAGAVKMANVWFDAIDGHYSSITNKFLDWADGPFANPLTVTGMDEDPDQDGRSNFMEFAFGTDPTDATSGALAIDGSSNGSITIEMDPDDSMYLYFVRRDDHGTSGSVNYQIEFTNDLQNYVPNSVTPDFVADSAEHSDYEIVRVPYPTDLPGGNDRVFGRVIAEFVR